MPPSVETSTPATAPPVSVAVPETVTAVPSVTVALLAGAVSVATGAVVSVVLVARVSPLAGANGCAPMSASRLTVAWRIVVFGALPIGFALSRPQDHCTVPAPKTSALPFLCIVRLCVAVPIAVVVPWSVKISTPETVVEERRNWPAGRKPLSGSSSHS